MISVTLLVWILLLEGALLAGLLALFFGHGLWMWWCRRQHQSLLTQARAALVAAQEGPAGRYADRQWLHTLPVRLQIRLFADLAPSLSGTRRQQLTALAQELGLMRHAEARCRSRRW